MAFTVTPAELQTFLAIDTIDVPRATQLLQFAADLASSIVTPLPDTAKGIVLAVAGRAYTNVSSAHSVGLGSAQVSFGGTGASTGVGGLWLSRSDITTLRRLAGASGAFTIDPTPADAGTGLPPWDLNVTWLGGIPLIEEPR